MLDNPRSERARAVSALARRAVRDRRGQFIVEGPQAVRELLAHAAPSARELYLTQAAADRHPDLVDAAGTARVPVRPCTEPVVAAMADTPHPQGVLAVADRVDVPVEEAVRTGRDGVLVVLAHVRDPGNAGTVLRAADAFGAAAVLVSAASVDLYNPKVVRSTAGSLFHVPISVGSSVAEMLECCRAQGLRLLGADGSGTTLLPEADLDRPHAWVFGTEAHGLGREVLEACDDVVRIPIVRAESLNLAMAATVCLHASSTASRG